jgi:hypothetical protein
MKALTDAVGLWALGLGERVIDVLNREIELVLVSFGKIGKQVVGQLVKPGADVQALVRDARKAQLPEG